MAQGQIHLRQAAVSALKSLHPHHGPRCAHYNLSGLWRHFRQSSPDQICTVDRECMPPAGSTALHIATRQGHADCVALLLKGGAAIDAADSNGQQRSVFCSPSACSIISFFSLFPVFCFLFPVLFMPAAHSDCCRRCPADHEDMTPPPRRHDAIPPGLCTRPPGNLHAAGRSWLRPEGQGQAKGWDDRSAVGPRPGQPSALGPRPHQPIVMSIPARLRPLTALTLLLLAVAVAAAVVAAAVGWLSEQDHRPVGAALRGRA